MIKSKNGPENFQKIQRRAWSELDVQKKILFECRKQVDLLAEVIEILKRNEKIEE